jgi:hypothetical protein
LSDAPIIFLDIDGVLNGHDFDAGAQSCTIRPECVREFNRVLAGTGAVCVLSSAWRYLVTRGDMTLAGFEYMLQTHGVAGCRLIGHTAPDEHCVWCGHRRTKPNLNHETKQPTCPVCDRECEQAAWIRDWLFHHGSQGRNWLVLDDLPLPGLESRHIWTDGNFGLSSADADHAIAYLTGPMAPAA